MTLSWLVVGAVLFAALLHASWNALVKSSQDKDLAPQLLDQHPALAQRHVERWLGGKSDYLKA